MLETLEYTHVDGSRNGPAIKVYALSTCGFCKKAMRFLEEHGFAYDYIEIDRIPVETKNKAKDELKKTYNSPIAFPFATIDEKSYLVGFIEADWKRELGV